MLGAPKVKDVRGFSDFGYSYVYVIFEEGTDIYWARSRTLEYLSEDPAAPAAGRRRPSSGRTPPASAGSSSTRWSTRPASTTWPSCARTRTGILRYQLQAVPGVAEVAPLGGFVRQYQVNVDPNRLARLQHPDRESGRGGARRQQRRRRPAGGIRRPRVHGARPRLCDAPQPTSANIVAGRQRRRACRSACATSAP